VPGVVLVDDWRALDLEVVAAFVPGVVDAGIIAALVRAVDSPLNVMAMPGAPSTSDLGQLGVARVSVGPMIAQAACAATRQAVRELLEHGTYGRPDDILPFSVLNAVFPGA
jgi:2-methylisocitrate lyase-like PEP mutase family enzyme